MACVPCAAQQRLQAHRMAVQRPVAQQPWPWPAILAEHFRASVCASRRAVLAARAWLQTQPPGARRLENLLFVQCVEEQIRAMEQGLLRIGVTD